jgi:hypothetical protein
LFLAALRNKIKKITKGHTLGRWWYALGRWKSKHQVKLSYEKELFGKMPTILFIKNPM